MADARIRVRVTPRAGRDTFDGWRDGALRVRVSAAPADDAANESLVRLIAKAAGVPPSRVSIITGTKTRMKTLEIEGLTEEEALARLSLRG